MDKKQVEQIIKTVSEPVEIKLSSIKEYYNDYAYYFHLEYAGIEWVLAIGTTTSASPNEDDNKTKFRIFDSSGVALFSLFRQHAIDATITGSWEFLLFKAAIELADKMLTEIEKEDAKPKKNTLAKQYERTIGNVESRNDTLTKQYKQIIGSDR